MDFLALLATAASAACVVGLSPGDFAPGLNRYTYTAQANPGMGEETFKLDIVDPRGPEAAELISALSTELARRYDYMEDGSGGFMPEDALSPRGAFVIGRFGGSPVACGAIRPLKGDIAELKRVFVKVDFRGRGYSKDVVNELERQARARGYKTMRLETGVRQPEAISLYQSLGYRRIPNYGEYRDSGMSVCFEKTLD